MKNLEKFHIKKKFQYTITDIRNIIFFIILQYCRRYQISYGNQGQRNGKEETAQI